MRDYALIFPLALPQQKISSTSLFIGPIVR